MKKSAIPYILWTFIYTGLYIADTIIFHSNPSFLLFFLGLITGSLGINIIINLRKNNRRK